MCMHTCTCMHASSPTRPSALAARRAFVDQPLLGVSVEPADLALLFPLFGLAAAFVHPSRRLDTMELGGAGSGHRPTQVFTNEAQGSSRCILRAEVRLPPTVDDDLVRLISTNLVQPLIGSLIHALIGGVQPYLWLVGPRRIAS